MALSSRTAVLTAPRSFSIIERAIAVIINPIISCGHCDMCHRSMQNLCRNAGVFGREVDGSLAELVHVAGKHAHPFSIIGSRALHPADMAPSIALASNGKIHIKGFVSGKFPLSQTDQAFKAYEGNANGVLRLVIDSREG